MKKLLLALILTSTSAFTATTGTLVLTGIVPQNLSIVINPTPISSNLDLSTTQTDLKVATSVEKSNSQTGYKVSITSANLGKLKRVSGTEVIPYTLKYNNNSVNLASTQIVVNAGTGPQNLSKDISISYTGLDLSATLEGTYTDTLTLSISSN